MRSLVVQQRKLLYLLSNGSSVNRLWRVLSSFVISSKEVKDKSHRVHLLSLLSFAMYDHMCMTHASGETETLRNNIRSVT